MTECVAHTGAIRSDGYGQVWTHPYYGKMAHRAAWEEQVGPIPEGLEIDHLCRNRACVNTQHMEIVTGAENSARSWHGGTPPGHCHQGHKIGQNKRCLVCRIEYDANRYQRKKEDNGSI